MPSLAELLSLETELRKRVDALPSGGGSASWTEYEIDFGSGVGVFDATFIVTAASVSGTSKVAVVQSGTTATARGEGDALWDGITYAAVPAAGQFTLYAKCSGPVSGKRKILYQVG